MATIKTNKDIVTPVVSAEAARRLAGGYILDSVGDLLDVTEPWLEEDRWVMSITLSRPGRGVIGHVGTISVHAASGELLFSEEDRQQVKASARALAGASSL